MDEADLRAAVREAADELGVPGVAVGIYHQGSEQYAFHGVTSTENPLPVDASTLFQFGSTGKTYTATAIMRLVSSGQVELEVPVRRYVPELTLKDEATAQNVTVLQLLNHTAGWDGDLFDNTGTGDDALERMVARMVRLEQVTPLGTMVSYNNAALSLAGRIIEKVTGKTFEDAMTELIFEPLGLSSSFYFPTDVMTRRFVAGHNWLPDGTVTVARPWALPRGANPAGGITSNAADLIKWARFHLGDGTAADGTRVLPETLLRGMRTPTAESPGNAVGDAVGIAWWLREAGDVQVVGHGGNTIGQDSSFDMVPEHDFAVICLANSSPNGGQFNKRIWRWALRTYLNVEERDLDLAELTEAELLPYTGRYETIADIAEISPGAQGRLLVATSSKPEILAELGIQEDPDMPPFSIALLDQPGDAYMVTDGPMRGRRGFFTRSSEGVITGIHLGGRLAAKASRG